MVSVNQLTPSTHNIAILYNWSLHGMFHTSCPKNALIDQVDKVKIHKIPSSDTSWEDVQNSEAGMTMLHTNHTTGARGWDHTWVTD